MCCKYKHRMNFIVKYNLLVRLSIGLRYLGLLDWYFKADTQKLITFVVNKKSVPLQ